MKAEGMGGETASSVVVRCQLIKRNNFYSKVK